MDVDATVQTQILGNEKLVSALLERSRTGNLGHAMLMRGAPSTGKTSIAKFLAGILLDAGRWPGPLETHPDLWLEDSAAERISIDRIRAGQDGALQDFLAMAPYQGGRRVAIIARAERLTEQAANSLLKSIEEPPPNSHLFVLTSEPGNLPQTIISRCEQITVTTVSGDQISDWLQSDNRAGEKSARLIAQLAAGRPGRAKMLLENRDQLEDEMSSLQRFLSIPEQGLQGPLTAAEQFASANSRSENREKLAAQLAVWSNFARDAACLAAGETELVRWTLLQSELKLWAQALPPRRITQIARLLLQASADVAAYANPRLTLEVLFLAIFASPHESAPPAVQLSAELLAD